MQKGVGLAEGGRPGAAAAEGRLLLFCNYYVNISLHYYVYIILQLRSPEDIYIITILYILLCMYVCMYVCM